MSESTCRSCGAAVRFVPTGKIKPNGYDVFACLDLAPTENGNYEEFTDGRGVTLVQVIKVEETERMLPFSPRFTSHHQTCPEAGKWRKKK